MVDVINQIRNYVTKYIKSYQFESAIFWAEKLLIKSENSPTDMLLYAEAIYHNGEFRRVIDFITKYKLGDKYLTFRLLIARSYFALKETIDAIQILDHQSYNFNANKSIMNNSFSGYMETSVSFNGYDCMERKLFGTSLKELESSCYILLGEIYEYMGHRDTSIEYYKLALKSDVKCYSAAQKLFHGNMLSRRDARILLDSLCYYDCDDIDIAKVIQASYEDLFTTECQSGLEISCQELSSSSKFDITGQLNIASRYFSNSKFKKAYEITRSIIRDDPYNLRCAILHVAILKELNSNSELFIFASNLMENIPDKKESWYAVGCYHLAIKNYSYAIKQFLKALDIDKYFGFAWMALGHTYSLEKESDQALAAYCSASQSIRDSHLSTLYIALEHSLSNNHSVSVNYLQEALNTGSHDPLYWHERGFISYNYKNYEDSLKFSLTAYDLSKDEYYSLTGFWEPLYNNIAHSYYKLGFYDKSLEFFEKALGKKPKNPSTMISMALVFLRQGNISKATDYLTIVYTMDEENVLVQHLMKTCSKLNCKYFDCSSGGATLQGSVIESVDVFKIPQSLSNESFTAKTNLGIHFESLRSILKKDAEKMSKEKTKSLF